jgi:hypothetical protein
MIPNIYYVFLKDEQIYPKFNQLTKNKLAVTIENSEEVYYFTKFNHKIDKLIRYLRNKKLNSESRKKPLPTLMKLK